MKAEKYNLEVRLNIVKQHWTGPLNPDGTADEDNEVSDGYWQTTPERLEVYETIDLGRKNFLQVMQILAHLHNSVVKIKEINADN